MHLSSYNIPHGTLLELDLGKRQVVLMHGTKPYGGSVSTPPFLFLARPGLVEAHI